MSFTFAFANAKGDHHDHFCFVAPPFPLPWPLAPEPVSLLPAAPLRPCSATERERLRLSLAEGPQRYMLYGRSNVQEDQDHDHENAHPLFFQLTVTPPHTP